MQVPEPSSLYLETTSNDNANLRAEADCGRLQVSVRLCGPLEFRRVIKLKKILVYQVPDIVLTFFQFSIFQLPRSSLSNSCAAARNDQQQCEWSTAVSVVVRKHDQDRLDAATFRSTRAR